MAGKTIEQHAEEASRALSPYYGRVARFNENPQPPLSCKDWFLGHWRDHPATSPLPRLLPCPVVDAPRIAPAERAPLDHNFEARWFNDGYVRPSRDRAPVLLVGFGDDD